MSFMNCGTQFDLLAFPFQFSGVVVVVVAAAAVPSILLPPSPLQPQPWAWTRSPHFIFHLAAILTIN